MNKIDELIQLVKTRNRLFIQTHNFPDHDAVASAFALQHILKLNGIDTEIIYEGSIDREALIEMISYLGISIKHASTFDLKEDDAIIIVDGCKGNKNITDLPGVEIAVIDHHVTVCPDDVCFKDIRQEYGACSTIIYTYYSRLGIEIPASIATAMIAGIYVDTSFMTRGLCEEDVDAYAHLYPIANISFVNANLRNKIQVKDLAFYKSAIERVRITNRAAFCYFDEGCNQNLLGILGDFFLSLSEVDFVFLCAKNNSMINFSLRSEARYWNASSVIQDALKGIGFGGGHAEMAGGIINSLSFFDEYKMHDHLIDLLSRKKNEYETSGK